MYSLSIAPLKLFGLRRINSDTILFCTCVRQRDCFVDFETHDDSVYRMLYRLLFKELVVAWLPQLTL